MTPGDSTPLRPRLFLAPPLIPSRQTSMRERQIFATKHGPASPLSSRQVRRQRPSGLPKPLTYYELELAPLPKAHVEWARKGPPLGPFCTNNWLRLSLSGELARTTLSPLPWFFTDPWIHLCWRNLFKGLTLQFWRGRRPPPVGKYSPTMSATPSFVHNTSSLCEGLSSFWARARTARSTQSYERALYVRAPKWLFHYQK